MLFKLVLNNIRKSYKDYLIYFLTIVITISLYYMFNSIESQKAMMAFENSDYNVVEVLVATMSYVSGFLTFVMGFLMVYANQFLVKRRKKELGLYMTLGMNRHKIAMILFLETLLTGIVSLVVGIFIGFIGSHFLSIITAKMFLFELKEFRFIFSVKAMFQSMAVFGVVYLIMMLFNSFTLMRVKLISLLYPKKNERQKIKRSILNIGIFILSIVTLGYAYYCITINGMLNFNNIFLQAILFGIIGSFLFFMSLAGIAYNLIKRIKPVYYYQLNVFSMRQIFSKVNTTYKIMAIISIMLLIAIGTFATGNGTAMAINENIKEATPFDFTYKVSYDVTAVLKDLPGEHYVMNVHETESTYDEILDTSVFKEFNVRFDQIKVPVIRLSDYNENRKARGLDSIHIKLDEALISHKNKYTNIDFDDVIGKVVTLGGKQLTITDRVVESMITGDSDVGLGYIIVNDESFFESSSFVNIINTRIDDPQIYNDFFNHHLINEDAASKYYDLTDGLSYSLTSKEVFISSSIGYAVVITYVAIYVGITFIIASVVILALQQLTEASDNIHRYQLLMKLGVEESQIKHSILVQISTYFLLPLMLSIVHSYVGVKVSTGVVEIFGYLDAFKNTLITSAFVLAIYGSYFVVTYITIKSMVLNDHTLRKN